MKTIRRRHALHEEARHQLVPIMRRANLRGGYVSALGHKRTFHNARLAVHFIPKVDISERSQNVRKAKSGHHPINSSVHCNTVLAVGAYVNRLPPLLLVRHHPNFPICWEDNGIPNTFV
jgi:hypothetical protein